MRTSIHLATWTSMTLFLFVAFAALRPQPAQAQTGILRSQCAGDVIVVQDKDDLPDAKGAQLLRRANGQPGAWQRLTATGKTIHWYCHDDSIWRQLDPRSWRIKSVFVDAKCDESGTDCVLSLNVGIGLSAIDGWYPESSRCASGLATHIRLGPGDALDLQCS